MTIEKETYEIRICRSREEHFYIEASSEEEAEKIAEIMQVPVMVGTVCFGSPYVGAGCVASNSDALVGSGSTGPELNRIEDALGLI